MITAIVGGLAIGGRTSRRPFALKRPLPGIGAKSALDPLRTPTRCASEGPESDTFGGRYQKQSDDMRHSRAPTGKAEPIPSLAPTLHKQGKPALLSAAWGPFKLDLQPR